MLEHSIMLKTHLNNTFSKPNFIANFSENLEIVVMLTARQCFQICAEGIHVSVKIQSLSSLLFFLWQTDPSGETRKM